jgi:hypothetical protein
MRSRWRDVCFATTGQREKTVGNRRHNIGFQIKILDCVIGRNPRQRTYQYALLGFLPLALPKSLSESL